MRSNPYPFAHNEIKDTTTRRTIIAVARPEQPTSRSAFAGTLAGGVGAILWGCNQVIPVWLAGYAVSEDLLKAAMVKQLLDRHIGDERLVVYSTGLAEQLKHVRRSDGLKADRKSRYVGFDLLKPIQQAHDRGKWSLQDFRKGEGPIGHERAKQPAKYALGLAQDRRMDFEASEHRRADCHIIEYGFGRLPDDDDEPY